MLLRKYRLQVGGFQITGFIHMKSVEMFNRVSGFYRFPGLRMLEGMRNHPSEQPDNIRLIE